MQALIGLILSFYICKRNIDFCQNENFYHPFRNFHFINNV